VDTVAVQLLTMNQKMANEADLQLMNMAPADYVLMEENYWVRGLGNDTVGLLADEYVSLEAQFYSLDSTLLTTHQAETQVGKVDEIQAIVYVLAKMQRGMHVSMLVPWYMAFGSAGNQDVRPYENIRVELTIK